MTEKEKKEFNDIPVYFCTKCLSLKIKTLDGTDIDFCCDCGSTDIEQCHIDEWRKKYRRLFGKKV